LIIVNAALFTIQGAGVALSDLSPTKVIALHKVIFYIFTAEVLLKLYARGLSYLKNFWNALDFTVVTLAFIAVIFHMPMLALLLIFRTLRIAEIAPQLKKVVESFFLALPHVTAVLLLIILIYYIYGVLGMELYKTISPNFFGTFSGTLYTLVQLTALDSWADVSRPIIEKSPYAWIYFVSFAFLVSFSAINLIVGVFVDSVQKRSAELHAERVRKKGKISQTLHDLKKHITDLEAHLEKIEEQIKVEVRTISASKPASKNLSSRKPVRRKK
jgi:voltage-gated sodium channel